MSRTIETILRLQGESEYRTGLKNCASEMKVLKSELSLVSSEFRTNANSMDALTAKGEVLSRMYANQEQKVDLLRSALENARKTQAEEQQTVDHLREQYEQAKKSLSEYGDEVDKNSEEYKKAQTETTALGDSLAKHQIKLDAATNSITKYTIQLNRAEVDLNALGDRQDKNNRLLNEAKGSADGCAVSIDRYGGVVRGASEESEHLSSAMESLATSMVANGIQEKVEDLAASMMEASEAAQEYELAIAQVSTIADSNVLSKDAASSGLLQLSTDLRRDANEVAEAAYEALSAGVATANVLEFTAQSSQLAVAGFTDTATSVDVLTTILNAYKLEASQTEKVASTLVKTQDLGKITVDQLASVIGRVIPSAAAYGVNLDNVAAAYANMTASGINAENSTTYMSSMLDELADNGSNVADVLKEQTGKSFAELIASGQSLGDVLDIIGKSVDNDKTKFSNLWSSASAGKAAISLFNVGAEEFNKTLDQMAGSSGTVAKNYRKMTDVSDYASQRVTVASKNLSIVVGDQLNPVLDKLRNAGAAVMEVAAKIVADNPILVSAITGLVVSLGLLSAGLSGLMIVKSVTAAMAALNIALAANPIGLVAVAVAGLGAALATFVSQTADSSERVNDLTEAAQRLNERTTTGARDYADAVASAETAYAMCDGYISRLAELEAQGKLTSEQQHEYSMLIDEIKTLMPELNIELEEETGLIKGGAAALLDKAAAWKDAAIAEALYTHYKDDIAAMVDAEYELAKNKAKHQIATTKLTEASERQEQLLKEIAVLQQEYNRVLSDSNLTSEEATQESQRLLVEWQGLQSELREMIEIEESAKTEQEALTQAIAEGESAVASNKEAVDASKQALEILSITYPQLAAVVSDSSAAMADGVSEAEQKMDEAYLEMWQSARTSLDQQIGLFEELDGKCEQSTEDMINALQSQKKAFEDYATNIETALARGIDIGLIQKLSDGSSESMLILAELVTGTDEQIAELNEAFNGVSTAKDNVATTMSGIKSAVEDGLEDMTGSVYTEGKSLGQNIGDGLIAGVKSKKDLYQLEIKRLFNSGFYSAKKTDQINSPSKRYMWLAAQNVQGLIVQYKADTPKLQKATTQMADAGYVAAIQARRSAIPSISSAVPTAETSSNSQTLTLLQQILDATNAGKFIVLDSGAVVGATVGQYDTAMGENQFLVDRGAK